MTVYEDLTIALDVVLAAATTVALYYGLFGMVRQSVRGDRLGSVGGDEAMCPQHPQRTMKNYRAHCTTRLGSDLNRARFGAPDA